MEIIRPKCGNLDETYFDCCTCVCDNCENCWGGDDNIFNYAEEGF